MCNASMLSFYTYSLTLPKKNYFPFLLIFVNCHLRFEFLRDIIFCRANFRNIFTNFTIFLDLYMFLVLYHYYTRQQASIKAFFSYFHDSNFHFTTIINFSMREKEILNNEWKWKRNFQIYTPWRKTFIDNSTDNSFNSVLDSEFNLILQFHREIKVHNKTHNKIKSKLNITNIRIKWMKNDQTYIDAKADAHCLLVKSKKVSKQPF